MYLGTEYKLSTVKKKKKTDTSSHAEGQDEKKVLHTIDFYMRKFIQSALTWKATCFDVTSDELERFGSTQDHHVPPPYTTRKGSPQLFLHYIAK